MTSLNDFAVPTLDHVAPFMAALEYTRSNTSRDEWRTMVKASPVIRSWRFFLSMDPYTCWGLVKPRGYAGDATLMDFAYGHESIRGHVSASGPTAKTIYAATSGARQSKSARERIELLRSELADTAMRRPITVVSVAAGHARELEGLPEPISQRVLSFTAVDLDSASLREAERSAGSIPFRPVRRNAIKDELDSCSPADLVYSLGLFDYLSDEHAATVLSKMLVVTAVGGKCIVANFAPDAANLGYCEAIMDWWMVTRSEESMYKLGRSCVKDQGVNFEIEVHRKGCFHYLQLVAA